MSAPFNPRSQAAFGPKPIGQVVEPPAEMIAAARRFGEMLLRGAVDAAIEMVDRRALRDVRTFANSLLPGAYEEVQCIGRARVAKHYWMKIRLRGRERSALMQARFAPTEDGGWTVRELMDLTNVRSGWT